MRVSLLAVAASALLAAAPAPAATVQQRAYQAALTAYVYGYPPVLSQLSAEKFPAQQLISINGVATPELRTIVLPNVDTPYTVANLDLAAEPFVLHVPAIQNRYYVFEFLDAYTNVIDYVGSRTTGTGAGDYVLAGPGFTGSVPAGLKVIRSPTNRIVVVGRTLFFGAGDLPDVRAIQESYGLQTLGAYQSGGAFSHGIIFDTAPKREPPVLPAGMAFFDALGDLLAVQHPPARDAKLLETLKRYGIGPGLHPSDEGLSAPVTKGLSRAAADGPKRIAALAAAVRRQARKGGHGWVLQTHGMGRYGTDYALRAVTANVGLWANTPDEAYYPYADQDSAGRRLDGRHRYVLRFAKGQLPPARAFWSLTMYDRDLFLVDNELDRYALGGRSKGMRRDRNGGLTLYLQHRRPAAARVGNWLPAPAGRFTVALRLYEPERRALDGRWKPPGIRRVPGPAR